MLPLCGRSIATGVWLSRCDQHDHTIGAGAVTCIIGPVTGAALGAKLGVVALSITRLGLIKAIW